MNGARVALLAKVTREGDLKYTATGTAMLRIGVLIARVQAQRTFHASFDM